MIKRINFYQVKTVSKLIATGFFLNLFSYTDCWAGAYLFNSLNSNVVTHPIGYTGTNQPLSLNVCIDSASLNVNEIVIPVQNVINTWNKLEETSSNLKINVLSSNQLDFESVLLHEMGHCLGLGHPNVTQSVISGAASNSTVSAKGTNNSYSFSSGSDGIYGSADDDRGDDENLHWFNTDNNPFYVIRPVSEYSYHRTLNHLPSGENFAVNADRLVSNAMGYLNTEAAMQQQTFYAETQRELAADDVSTLLFARMGMDRTLGTADDYTVTLNYAGIEENESSNNNCDISVSIDSSSFAYSSTSSVNLDSSNTRINTARIHMGTAYNWFFNTQSNSQSNVLSFNTLVPASYAPNQEGVGSVNIIDAGTGLNLTGNRWQQLELNYNISSDTVIEFDFSSSQQGDIHGIGLNNSLQFNQDHTFQLSGTQPWGLQHYHSYTTAGGVQHYIIPVGKFYTGQMKYLFFINDHDVPTPDANSLFSNVRVYENSETFQVPTITSTPLKVATINNSYSYDADNIVEANGTTPVSFSLQKGPYNYSMSSNGLVSWTPQPGQEGSHSISLLASNVAGSTSQSFIVDVSPETRLTNGFINFNNMVLDSFAGKQDGEGGVSIEDNGSSLKLTGNKWQQIPLNYTITSDTVIEFDYSSSTQAEIQGLGFNDNSEFYKAHTFQLFGSQIWGRQNFHSYNQANGVMHYVIPVGQYYIGTNKYLFFVNDHDVSSPAGESLFSNIRVYESNN